MAEQKRYALVYDSNKCIGCQACTLACRAENQTPEVVTRLQVRLKQKGNYPALRTDFERHSCMQCDDPPCVPVCPTQASYINEAGITLVDHDKCIGCKYCVVACPYQARFLDPVSGNVDKCTFCWETKTSKGEKPACASICPTGAIAFGDLNDPKSEMRQAMAGQHVVKAKEHLGAQPKVMTIPNWRGGEA